MVPGLAVKELMTGRAGATSGAVDGGAASSGAVMVMQAAVELINATSSTATKAQYVLCSFMLTPPFLLVWLIVALQLADDYITWLWRQQRRLLVRYVGEGEALAAGSRSQILISKSQTNSKFQIQISNL